MNKYQKVLEIINLKNQIERNHFGTEIEISVEAGKIFVTRHSHRDCGGGIVTGTIAFIVQNKKPTKKVLNIIIKELKKINNTPVKANSSDLFTVKNALIDKESSNGAISVKQI